MRSGYRGIAFALHCIALQCVALHLIDFLRDGNTLRAIALRDTRMASHCMGHGVALPCMTRHDIAWHFMGWCGIALTLWL